jgi:hypothetical protein
MKKSLYSIVAGLLCVTTGAQLFAFKCTLQNVTNYKIDVNLQSKGQPSSGTTIAPKSTDVVSIPAPTCVNKIRYRVNNLEWRDYKLPSSICKDAEIVIAPTSTPNEVQFITQR